jgi:3-methyladenine DNA glycosylase AlkD
VPSIRAAIEGADLPYPEIGKLLSSLFHEDRLAGALLLVRKAATEPRAAYIYYMKRLDRINNWDLVDLSAPRVVGKYLMNAASGEKERVFRKLSGSKKMWHRRVAMLATAVFIDRGRFKEALALAKRYLADREDLMHKATGWMLREVGKRSEAALKRFLDRYAAVMPRTMLRYSLEKFAESDRRKYMNKKRPRQGRRRYS